MRPRVWGSSPPTHTCRDARAVRPRRRGLNHEQAHRARERNRPRDYGFIGRNDGTQHISRARKTEREYLPTGRFITVDGVRLHYIEKGEGPPVVLLYGNVVTAEDFRTSGVLELLAGRHRVIAFDRPGFGYNDRPHGSAADEPGAAEFRSIAPLEVSASRRERDGQRRGVW